MKKFAFAVIAALVLAGCASAPKDGTVTTQVDTSLRTVSVVDWSDRTLDVAAKPEWLKKLVCGNTQIVSDEFGITGGDVIKYSVGTARSRDAALAASRVNYNAMRAEELKTKVVSEAAATLNDEGYTEAASNAAMLAKVDLTGHQLVTQFWQEVRTVDNETKAEKTEFLCYSVYKISKTDWLATLKAFMSQVIPAIPDSKAQVKMANTIQSLYDDTAKEQEKSENQAKAEIDAQIELARIEAEKQVGVAQANSPAPAQSSGGADFNWMDALELAANVIF